MTKKTQGLLLLLTLALLGASGCAARGAGFIEPPKTSEEGLGLSIRQAAAIRRGATCYVVITLRDGQQVEARLEAPVCLTMQSLNEAERRRQEQAAAAAPRPVATPPPPAAAPEAK